MNYLAIDTASEHMKVLIRYNGSTGYYQTDRFRSASECLMPRIDRMLSEMNAELSGMDFFACVVGPGSFTGIRIGMATIKAFAAALSKPVVSVNTLEVLAYNNMDECTSVAVCDASNGYRYVAAYDEDMDDIYPPRCIRAEDFSAFMYMIPPPFVIYGDAASRGSIRGALPPTNSREAFIRAVEYSSGTQIDGDKLEPLYIRKPQAEIDLEESEDDD